MARIKYTTEFMSKTALFYSVYNKNVKDGPKSILKQFLAEENIDMAKNKTGVDKAIETHKVFQKLYKQSEDFTQMRDNLFSPVFDNLKESVQFLKTWYRRNVRELGNWGITVDGDNAVKYPPSFEEKYELFITFYNKNKEMGEKSPLIPFLEENFIDMDKDKADADQANEYSLQGKQARLDYKEESNKRDRIFDPIFNSIRAIGQFLKRLFPKEMHKLGEWGYNIVESSPQMRVEIKKNPAVE